MASIEDIKNCLKELNDKLMKEINDMKSEIKNVNDSVNNKLEQKLTEIRNEMTVETLHSENKIKTDVQEIINNKCLEIRNNVREDIDKKVDENIQVIKTIKDSMLGEQQKMRDCWSKISKEIDDKAEGNDSISFNSGSQKGIRDETGENIEIEREMGCNNPLFFNEIVIKPFSGNPMQCMHPVDFLNVLRDKINDLGIKTERDKLRLAKRYLEGQAWTLFSVCEHNIHKFNEFEKWLLDNYWSPQMQLRVRSEVFKPKSYNPNGGDMLSHFLYWVNKTKHLDPPLDESVLVGAIIEHYSDAHICQFQAREINTIDGMIRLIRILDRPEFRQVRDVNNGNYNNYRHDRRQRQNEVNNEQGN